MKSGGIGRTLFLHLLCNAQVILKKAQLYFLFNKTLYIQQLRNLKSAETVIHQNKHRQE